MADTNTGSNDFSIPIFPTFESEMDSMDLNQKWKRYIRKFENLTIATNISDSKRKRALLLHYVGEAVNDIFETLNVTEDTYEATKMALDSHFAPSQNKEYQTYLFRKLKQLQSESLEQYNVRLRRAATSCGFENIEREIKSQIIMGCESTKLRRYALQTPTSTLKDLLAYGIASETVNKHVEIIENDKRSEVNYTRQDRDKYHYQNRNNRPTIKQYKETTYKPRDRQQCNNCGNKWHEGGISQCPARGKTCSKCGKLNHFAKICMTNQNKPGETKRNWQPPRQNLSVAQIEDAENNGFVFSNQEENRMENQSGRIILKINNALIPFMIDSGATVNIINKLDFDKIMPKPKIERASNLIYPYGQETPISMIGESIMNIQHKQQTHTVKFYISGNRGPSILSKDTSLKLNLIKFIHNITSTTIEGEDEYIRYIDMKHPQLVNGIGKHKTSCIRLHINPEIAPVSEKFRRIPFHMRLPVEKELNRLLADDIIEEIPEHTPTTWVSPIVVRPKKDDNNIRICVDMRAANKAIERERHVTPTIDDLIVILNNAAHFTKLDLNKGYHQFELSPESRHITTFATHKGLYRYKRLSFGINAAAEVFQKEINKIISNVPNTINISDDILIFGINKEEHDKALFKILNKLEEEGLTLNKQKCLFNKGNLKFYGHIFSQDGMKADPDKIKALTTAETPQSPGEMRSWLGMANFSARYIPHLATISQPLRELTKHNTPWKWENKHQAAFDEINSLLTRYTQLSYFNRARPTEIWTDASPTGLGALLVQNHNGNRMIISFASRSLTDVETRYSQLEREALAIAWAVEHFHIYIYGEPFSIITDHRPLVPLLTNPRAKLSTRLERWSLKLQGYRYQIFYSQGKDNPADYLSRHPIVTKSHSKTVKLAEEYTNFISHHVIPKSITSEEIMKETKNDALLQQVMDRLLDGKWHSKPTDGVSPRDIASFRQIKNELSITHNRSLLLRGHRAIMPLKLQDRAIEIAHGGHQGMTKTKKLMREKTWFNNINMKIEDKIKHCPECNTVTVQNRKLPLQFSEMPEKPWDYLHVDHKGPLPTGEYLLVIVDLYTRFPVIEIVGSTQATINITKLDQIFALLGTPSTICTDNGSPFNSSEFTEFTTSHNIHHRKITPLWPQANGEVERFNSTIAKTLKIAFSHGQNWKSQLTQMLRNYRATPHTTTQLAPAELLFNRKPNIGIPTAKTLLSSQTINKEKLNRADTQAKNKAQDRHQTKFKYLDEIPNIGDEILIKRDKANKMDTPYDPEPYTVKERKGPQIMAEKPGKRITRHVTQTKLLPRDNKRPEEWEEEETSKEQEMSEEPESSIEMLEPKEPSPSTTPEKHIDNTEDNKHDHNLRKERKRPQRLIEQIQTVNTNSQEKEKGPAKNKNSRTINKTGSNLEVVKLDNMQSASDKWKLKTFGKKEVVWYPK